MARALLPLLILGGIAGAFYLARPDRLFPPRPDLEASEEVAGGSPRGAGRRPASARTSPGGRLSFDLAEPPALRYADPDFTEADRKYAGLTAKLNGRYDATLGHAARELAGFYAQEGQLAPGEVLAFLLDAAGAVAWGVRQAVVVTTDDRDQAITDAVRRQLPDAGPEMRVGVGEAVLLGRPPRRVITVLVAPPGPQLDPVERAPDEGDEVVISGALPADHDELRVVAMDPDSRFVQIDVEQDGPDFTARFEATAGRWQVELLATGPLGPVPLAQLTFHVDAPLPDGLATLLPPDESRLGTVDEGTAAASAYLDADRRGAGLPLLQRDARLDAIAAAHSEDMRAAGFVGHRSPTTGDLADRLRAAGYVAVASGENVAFNASLWDAQVGLMRSLGHRRNIVSTELTRVGIGVARGADNWYLTQVFALPRPVLGNVEAARQTLRRRIDAARRAAGAPPMDWSDALDRAAQGEATRRDASPRGALQRAQKHGLRAAASAWVAVLATLDRFDPPETLGDPGFRRGGVGVYQVAGRDGPDIQVVLVLAE